MRRFFYVAVLIFMIISTFYLGIQAGYFNLPEGLAEFTAAAADIDESGITPSEDVHEEVIDPDLRTASLVIVGNIFPHEPQIRKAQVSEGVYDFSPSFKTIAPYLQQADLAVAILETQQAGPDITFHGSSGYTGWPLFNAPPELSAALRDAGIDLLALGNNHALDRGYDGLMATLDYLRRLGFYTFGAYKNETERNTTLIIDHDGIRIAFIGYTFSTNGIAIPEGHEYCVNYSPGFEDITPILADIEKARKDGADLIVIFPHWGEGEYVHEPDPLYYRQVTEEFAAAGADLIIGSHPKFIQPAEWFFYREDDGNERATFGVYSLGNFLTNQNRRFDQTPWPQVEFGLMLDIEITKDSSNDRTWISAVDYDINWIYFDQSYHIIPLSTVFDNSRDKYNLSDSQIEDLKKWHEHSIEVVESYGFAEGKSRAMAISEYLLEKAYGGTNN